MRQIFVRLLIAGCICCNGYFGAAQEVTVDESDISFDILKWHYHHYPNSTMSAWKIVDQGAYYKADFVFNGFDVVTIYSSEGKVLVERIDMAKNVPISLIHHLDGIYEKYKVKEFDKITDFTNETVYYEMNIKSKEVGEETLNFDEHLIPVDFNLISKAN